MIHYLVTKAGDHTFRNNPILDDPRLKDRFEIVLYNDAFERRRWRGGTAIFADVDRLPAPAAMRATVLHRRLGRAGLGLLNHPIRTCRRYELLRRLKQAGINRHDIFRIDELPKALHYPVFLRSESQHDGAFTDLLHDEAALQAEIGRLAGFGVLPQDLLVVEFCDTADADGIHRKATGYVVGDRVLQRYLFFGDHWQVKNPRSGTVATKRAEAAMLAAEEAFQDSDAYVSVLREVARLGGIGFGRIDFDIVDGRPEIWECNTNPDPAIVAFSRLGGRSERIVPRGWQMLRDALTALDDEAAHATEVSIEPVPRYEDLYRTMLIRSRERAGLPPPE
jgi:hypothetical protein